MDIDKLKNTIIWGDCLEVMPLISDGSVDMVLADLPYGKTANDWDVLLDLDKLWKQYSRIVGEDRIIAFTADFLFAMNLVNSNVKGFKHELILNKRRPSNTLQAKRYPLKIHEFVLIFSSGKMRYFPQGLKIATGPRGGTKRSKTKNMNVVYEKEYVQKYYNYPKSILEFSWDNSKNVNPTQKSVECFQYLIETYTKREEVVLDNVAGGLTTARACINSGRNFICIEKRLSQIKAAKEKYSELVGIKILKGKGGTE